jgi:regulator of protease activity HflC (stomatin/prohibitin superfamily)
MNWLLQLFEYLTCWIPRLYVVLPDEGGVRVTLGRHVRDCFPGWYIYWPLIHTFIKINVATQGVRFDIQSVITKDDVDIAIRGAVLYKISNARKAIFETNDFDQSLAAIAGGVIEEYVANHTYEELKDRQTLRTAVRTGLRKEADGWGIKLLRVYIPDVGRVRNIRILSDSIDNSQIIPDTK